MLPAMELNQMLPISWASSPKPEVSWHVIIWVLMSLALNSMAQPSHKMFGYFTRHRIYLCSFPILCIADAFYTMLSVTFTKFYLNITFRKASQIFTIIEKSHEPKKQPKMEDLKIEGLSWQRFIFIISIPLPAALKLASFSGTPWTKDWGMMFAVSFLIIEVVNFMARGSIKDPELSVRSILGYSKAEWEEGPQKIRRSRSTNLPFISKLLAVFMPAAILAQFLVLLYTISSLSRVAKRFTSSSDFFKWIYTYITYIVVVYLTIYGVLIGIHFIGLLIKWKVIRTMSARTELVNRLPHPNYPAYVWIYFKPTDTPPKGRIVSLKKIHEGSLCALVIIATLHKSCYWVITRVCRRWPGVGRALLIDRKPMKVKTDREQAIEGEVEYWSWVTLGAFLIHLSLCVLWYAYVYDPVGTANPAWTDVFG